MLARTPMTDRVPTTVRTVTTPVSSHRSPSARTAVNDRTLLLRMNFAHPNLAVLTATGDLDTTTAPQLADLLWPRLTTHVPAIVLDLRHLTFLGVAGLKLLANAHSYATTRGIRLSIVHNTPTVERALSAGGLDTTVPCFTTLSTASNASQHLLRQTAA